MREEERDGDFLRGHWPRRDVRAISRINAPRVPRTPINHIYNAIRAVIYPRVRGVPRRMGEREKGISQKSPRPMRYRSRKRSSPIRSAIRREVRRSEAEPIALAG